jgi:hypothetical protein
MENNGEQKRTRNNQEEPGRNMKNYKEPKNDKES